MFSLKSFATITTDRLLMTVPTRDDAMAIFENYASDQAVTSYVGWPRHRNLDDTFAFIEFSQAEWRRSSVGPYVIRDRQDGTILGSTGIGCDGLGNAMTGYVLAKAQWGQGIATEAVRAMIVVSKQLELRGLFALCHPAHNTSRRVLEKTGFQLDATWLETVVFPNIADGNPIVPACYRHKLDV